MVPDWSDWPDYPKKSGLPMTATGNLPQTAMQKTSNGNLLCSDLRKIAGGNLPQKLLQNALQKEAWKWKH